VERGRPKAACIEGLSQWSISRAQSRRSGFVGEPSIGRSGSSSSGPDRGLTSQVRRHEFVDTARVVAAIIKGEADVAASHLDRRQAQPRSGLRRARHPKLPSDLP
jgi:hypothetical protein